MQYVVTIFADDNKKYLSTDLLSEEPIKVFFLSSDIKLVDFRFLKRAYHTYCNTTDCVEANNFKLIESEALPICAKRHR